MPVSIFDLPLEIRLDIYEYALVYDGFVEYISDDGLPQRSPLSRVDHGLTPALLRTSQAVHREAGPILYSRNRFEFPDSYRSFRQRRPATHVTAFLDQIGPLNASHLRHLFITCPIFADLDSATASILPESVAALQRLGQACPGLRVLEMWQGDPTLLLSRKFSDANASLEAIQRLDDMLVASWCLDRVVVHTLDFYSFDWSYQAYRLIDKMRDCGWAVEYMKIRGIDGPKSDDGLDYDVA